MPYHQTPPRKKAKRDEVSTLDFQGTTADDDHDDDDGFNFRKTLDRVWQDNFAVYARKCALLEKREEALLSDPYLYVRTGVVGNLKLLSSALPPDDEEVISAWARLQPHVFDLLRLVPGTETPTLTASGTGRETKGRSIDLLGTRASQWLRAIEGDQAEGVAKRQFACNVPGIAREISKIPLVLRALRDVNHIIESLRAQQESGLEGRDASSPSRSHMTRFSIEYSPSLMMLVLQSSVNQWRLDELASVRSHGEAPVIHLATTRHQLRGRLVGPPYLSESCDDAGEVTESHKVWTIFVEHVLARQKISPDDGSAARVIIVCLSLPTCEGEAVNEVVEERSRGNLGWTPAVIDLDHRLVHCYKVSFLGQTWSGQLMEALDRLLADLSPDVPRKDWHIELFDLLRPAAMSNRRDMSGPLACEVLRHILEASPSSPVRSLSRSALSSSLTLPADIEDLVIRQITSLLDVHCHVSALWTAARKGSLI